jgi:hypothetical protein
VIIMYPLLHPSIHYHYVPTASSIHFSFIHHHHLGPSFHHPEPDQAERRAWKSSRVWSAWTSGPVTEPSRPKNAGPRHRAQSAKIAEWPETVTEVLGGGGKERPPASPGSPCRRPSKPPSQTKSPGLVWIISLPLSVTGPVGACRFKTPSSIKDSTTTYLPTKC